MRRHIVRGAELILGATILSLYAATGYAGPPIQFVTSNGSRADLAQEMTRFYLDASAQNQLRVMSIRDDLGWQVRNQMFGIGLLESAPPVPVFPKTLELQLCALNPRVCHQEPAGHARWTNRRGSIVCLPAFGWQDAWAVRPIHLRSDFALQTLEGQYGTCSLLQTRCANYLQSLHTRQANQGRVLSVILAKAYVEAGGSGVTQSGCTDATSAPNLSELITARGLTYIDPGLTDSLAPSVLAAAHGRRTPSVPSFRMQEVENTWRPAQRNVSAPASAAPPAPTTLKTVFYPSLHSVRRFSEDFRNLMALELEPTIRKQTEQDQRERLSVNSVVRAVTTEPQGSISALPPPVQEWNAHSAAITDIDLSTDIPEESHPTAGVIVFDDDPNPCHPVIAQATGGKDSHGKPCEPYSPFSQWRSPFTVLVPNAGNHGTHVSGLIAGRFGIGVAPELRLLLAPIPGGTRTEYNDDVEQNLIQLIDDGSRAPATHVMNMSISLNTKSRRLIEDTERALKMAGDVLFVAAAGNEGGELGRPCDIVPACFNVNNLIVVGGAIRSGTTWSLDPKSRHGAAVDIVAPSGDILSAAWNPMAIGLMSGTSQSTALVSGVAGRLFSMTRSDTTPRDAVQIKNRLLATSSRLADFAGIAATGLLDADRALDTRHTLIRERHESAQPATAKLAAHRTRSVIVLEVSRAGTADATVNYWVDNGNGTPGPKDHLNFCDLYRASKDPDTNLWTFIVDPSKASDRSARWTKLGVIHHAIVESERNIELAIRDEETHQADTVSLADVSEVYAAFSTDRLCAQ